MRSLQENFEPGSKAISTDPAPHNGSDEEADDKGPKKLQEIPVFKVEFCDELSVEDILMEILLHQQLHTSKEYTINQSSINQLYLNTVNDSSVSWFPDMLCDNLNQIL